MGKKNSDQKFFHLQKQATAAQRGAAKQEAARRKQAASVREGYFSRLSAQLKAAAA